MLNSLYNLIKNLYSLLKLYTQNGFKNIEFQYTIRENLNHAIREYIANGGKRDITRYCEYYV